MARNDYFCSRVYPTSNAGFPLMIEVNNISRSFAQLKVLKEINLTVERGEILSITGPSGAGKTTLLQIIGSLDRPDSFFLFYESTEIFTLNDKKLSRFRNANIGFVFQSHRLLPEFTLEENVAMPALIGGISRSEALTEARRLLDYLGLSERCGHRPSQLSGGECQRGAVARALINKPAVVLADEPSGSLDSQGRQNLHKLFFDLRRDFGQPFIIVTHDETLAAMADRRVVMADGRINRIDSLRTL